MADRLGRSRRVLATRVCLCRVCRSKSAAGISVSQRVWKNHQAIYVDVEEPAPELEAASLAFLLSSGAIPTDASTDASVTGMSDEFDSLELPSGHYPPESSLEDRVDIGTELGFSSRFK